MLKQRLDEPGVRLKSQYSPTVVAKVHHHWVTEAGDTIFLENATATTFQVGTLKGVYAAGGIFARTLADRLRSI